MSAAMQLSLAAISASAARNALQVPLDADGAEDLYAVWKSVFERARAVEPSNDGTSPSAVDSREFDAGDHARHASGSGADRRDAAHSTAVFWIDASTIQQVATAPSTSGAWTNAVTKVEQDPSSASRPPMTAQRGVNTAVAAAAQASLQSHELDVASSRGTNAASKSAAVATQPASPESVNVFVQGAAVAIVVRDTAISADEALQCAFETARELTGQRAALQQLTLNGRTIYQQHSDSGARGAMLGLEQPEAVLEFAC